MIKRLKVSDFSDYKLTQDSLTTANSLQPIWVTTKRMEVCRTKDKTGIKFNLDEEVEIFNDNLQTLRLLTKEGPLIKTKLKHVDIFQHWLRERVQTKEIRVSWIGTGDMVADGMTKALSKQKHLNFLRLLNLIHIDAKQDSK